MARRESRRWGRRVDEARKLLERRKPPPFSITDREGVTVSSKDRARIDELHSEFNRREHEIAAILGRNFGVQAGLVVHSPWPKNPKKRHGSFDIFYDRTNGNVVGFYDNSRGV
jgi:hypothetical protein